MRNPVIAMSNSKKPVEYKHRETFKYKGLVYKYDKPYGEWRTSILGETKFYSWRGINFPFTIFSGDERGRWTAGHFSGATPLAALKKWETQQLRAAKVREKSGKAIIKESQAIQRLLNSNRWKK